MSNHPAVQLFLPSHPRCWSGCQIALDSQSAAAAEKTEKHLGSQAFLVLPSGNLTWLLKTTSYSGFSHWKWWFSIVMLNYQRVTMMIMCLWCISGRLWHCQGCQALFLCPASTSLPWTQLKDISNEKHITGVACITFTHGCCPRKKGVPAYPMSNPAWSFLIIQNCCLLLHLQQLEDPTMLQHAPNSMHGPSKQKSDSKTN